jgi:hypothetical protein
VAPRALAPPEGEADQPKHQEDDSRDPKQMNRETEPEQEQYDQKS